MKNNFAKNIAWILPLALLAVVFTFTASALAQYQETTLYTFSGTPNGGDAQTGLVADGAGNFYGTTTYGGNSVCFDGNGCGTVFKLSPASGGGWTETVIYEFNGQGSSTGGAFPWSGLIFDSAGNLYGEASNAGPGGFGTVFRLSPSSGGTWTYTVLYGFEGALTAGTHDGDEPTGGLIFDAKGNLYGTTMLGGGQGVSNCSFFGTDGCGTIFKLTPASTGYWKETQLYAFTGGTDGAIPYGGLSFDSKGDLVGSAAFKGGSSASCEYGCGSLFHLTPHPTGWRFSRIYEFNFKNGAVPHSRLTSDSANNLYGTTDEGGSKGEGIVFELSPTTTGIWKEAILHAFTGGSDGANCTAVGPEGPLLFNASGSIFGSAPCGGTGGGTVYELTPATGGSWTFNLVFSFPGLASGTPAGHLISDANGDLFGTTLFGGPSGSSQWGTIFELSPTTASSQR
jgi:uncharacterized repeat protein (TIGR03803 family)